MAFQKVTLPKFFYMFLNTLLTSIPKIVDFIKYFEIRHIWKIIHFGK